ncbi:MAG: glycoside hydrolase family 18 protein [Lachnospiraceae bacterium]|nr:glycoside hydrolase family 18 protein [Lachnospiraceae bacterium]
MKKQIVRLLCACAAAAVMLSACGSQEKKEEAMTEEMTEEMTETVENTEESAAESTEETSEAAPTPEVNEEVKYIPDISEVSPVSEDVLPRQAGEYVIAYYTSWCRYDADGLRAKDIDAAKLTHIHYAFAETTWAFAPFANNIDDHLENLQELASLKEQNPDLKLVLSIGGGGGDKYFKIMCSKDENLKIFTEGCLDFLTTYDFDGIDLDWEFPSTPAEMKGFTNMVLCLRKGMDELGQETGKHYSLSLAGAADSGELKGIDYEAVEPFLDYVFIMGYNLYGTWSPTTNFNAPMYAPGEEKYTGYSLYTIVDTYIKSDIPANKLVLGLPLYGYVLPVTETENNGLYQRFKPVSYDTAYESCRNIFKSYLNDPDFTEFWDEDTQSPYLFGNDTFIGYENERSIEAKSSLVKEFGLAGVGFWELSQDTEDFAMLNTAYEAMTTIRQQ